MSIIPPTDIIKSKILYFLRKKITDNDEFDSLKQRLGPFPFFRIQIQLKSTEDSKAERIGSITKVSDENLLQFISGDEPYSKAGLWDDIDAGVFMYKRCVKPAKEFFSDKIGQLRFSLQSTYDEDPTKAENWSDVFVDEIMLNQVSFFPSPAK